MEICFKNRRPTLQDGDASYVVYTALLDASSHLYKRLCPSICPSIHRSVCRSVHNAFVKISENGIMRVRDASYVVYMALIDASSHVYIKVYPSVRRSIDP